MVQDGNLIRLSAFEQLTYLPSLSVNQVFVTMICFASALSGRYDQIVFSQYWGFCFQGEELVSQHITITRQRELLTISLYQLLIHPTSWLLLSFKKYAKKLKIIRCLAQKPHILHHSDTILRPVLAKCDVAGEQFLFALLK